MRNYVTYTATKSNRGSALTLWVNLELDDIKKAPSVNLQLTAQAGWNDETKKGFFKDNFGNKEKQINFKLGLDEIARIVSVLNGGDGLLGKDKGDNLYHSYNGTITTLCLEDYKGKKLLKVARNQNSTWLNIDQCLSDGNNRLLATWLDEALRFIFHNEPVFVKNENQNQSQNETPRTTANDVGPAPIDDEEIPF